MTKILVADDEPMMWDALAKILVSEGYTVAQAANGKDACEAVTRHGPDVMLLDVDIPVMNGFEVLKSIRGNPETLELPIVMLTSTPAVVGEQAALVQGVTHYISKPWKADIVQAAVRNALRSVNLPVSRQPEESEAEEEAEPKRASKRAKKSESGRDEETFFPSSF